MAASFGALALTRRPCGSGIAGNLEGTHGPGHQFVLIVANPLETMDAPTIEASLVAAEGVLATTGGKVSKAAFAEWLLEAIERARVARRGASLQACERPGE